MAVRPLSRAPVRVALVAWLAASALTAQGPTAGVIAISPRTALGLPGMASLLPPGTVAGDEESSESSVVTTAVQVAGEDPSRLRIGLILREWAGGAPGPDDSDGRRRRARLVVARRKGARLVAELEADGAAGDVLALDAGRHGPRGEAVIAAHWASGPGPHEGVLQVWLFDDDAPRRALESVAEGFYFEDVDGVGHDQLVLYRPEPGSLVYLPAVLDWKEGRLVDVPGAHDALDRRLLQEWREILDSYSAESEGEYPPRMVIDVALLVGRLLERRGEVREAFLAYERAIDLVPAGGLFPSEPDLAEHREVLARAAEARRRAAALYGLK